MKQTERKEDHAYSYRGRKLKIFPKAELEKHDQIRILSCEDNPLKNFVGLPSLPELTDLHLDRTEISSFYGVPELPSLQNVTFKMSPLGYYKKLDLMCSIVFGPQLRFVNGEEIAHEKIKFAIRYRDLLLPYFRDGWILTSRNPVRFIHSKTRARISVKIPLPSPQLKKKQLKKSPQTQIDDNYNDINNDEDPHQEDSIYSNENDDENSSKSTNSTLMKADLIMKELNDELSKNLRKKEILNGPTYATQQENRIKYSMKDKPQSLRALVRKPGGIQDPFTFSPQITYRPKPTPEVEIPLRKTKRNSRIRTNKKAEVESQIHIDESTASYNSPIVSP